MVIGSPLGQFHHPFGLEAFAMVEEELADLLAVPFLADQRLVGGDDAAHLLLDRGQVLVGERAAAGGRREVVIETVVGRRAEGDLRAGKQVLHRLGEDMGKIVAASSSASFSSRAVTSASWRRLRTDG